jgi:hypothetical protein
LDVDEFPDFKNLDRSFSNLVTTFGWARVKGNGTNPWTTVWVMDSLTAQLKRGDWNAAYQSAADLGHYVGDPHQPLHAANNYDGKLTGNTGIHSRYESTMLDTNRLKTITLIKDSVKYISDVYGFAFDYILKSNSLCDSIFHADNAAKVVSGGSYSTQYYDVLWQRLGDMTKAQIQSATIDLASLWYTAWVNAGLLSKPTSVEKIIASNPKSFNLLQNFPNPFNPATVISYQLPVNSYISLKVYDALGREVATLVNEEKEAGTYSVTFSAESVSASGGDGSKLSSGIYFYTLISGDFAATKKLVLMK